MLQQLCRVFAGGLNHSQVDRSRYTKGPSGKSTPEAAVSLLFQKWERKTEKSHGTFVMRILYFSTRWSLLWHPASSCHTSPRSASGTPLRTSADSVLGRTLRFRCLRGGLGYCHGNTAPCHIPTWNSSRVKQIQFGELLPKLVSWLLLNLYIYVTFNKPNTPLNARGQRSQPVNSKFKRPQNEQFAEVSWQEVTFSEREGQRSQSCENPLSCSSNCTSQPQLNSSLQRDHWQLINHSTAGCKN